MTAQNIDIWLSNPAILFDKESLTQVWPNKNMNKNEKINAITRLVIILSILGFLITKSLNFMVTGFITLGVITALYYTSTKVNTNETIKENFTNPQVYNALKSNFTNPTEKNPFMNVLLPEINKEPNRKMAAPAYNPAVEKQINNETINSVASNFDNDKNIKKKLFSTLGNSFEFEDFAQHNFYTTANTKIPNDQKGFAEFCYGNMPSAKEGNDFAIMQGNPRIGAIVGQQ